MSQIRTPPSLKWLINKRARLLGEINKYENTRSERMASAEKAVADATHALNSARQRLACEQIVRPKYLEALREDIKAIDNALALHDIQIDPEIIPQIRSQEAQKKLPHGVITRAIYEYFKVAGNRPVSTTEIAMFVAVRNNIETAGDIFQVFRTSVRYRLKNLCIEGKVERLHPPKTALEGRWKLK